MNKNFNREKPIFFVVSVGKEDPSNLKIVKRCAWKTDANRFAREYKKATGEKFYVISTLDWL